MTEKLLLRPAEAAELLSISRSKIYELVNAGEIPSIRLGGAIRIPRRSLEEFISRQMEAADDAA